MFSEEHQRRLAVNESRFRDINEGLERDVRPVADEGEVIDFVCECARTECRATIQLTIAEYAMVRGSDHQFVVIPGHQIHEIERVIADRGRYALIAKIGAGADEAERQR